MGFPGDARGGRPRPRPRRDALRELHGDPRGTVFVIVGVGLTGCRRRWHRLDRGGMTTRRPRPRPRSPPYRRSRCRSTRTRRGRRADPHAGHEYLRQFLGGVHLTRREPVHGHQVTNRHRRRPCIVSPCPVSLGGPLVVTPHAPTHAAHGPEGRVPDGWGDTRGTRRASGRCIRHAPAATPRAVGPLAVPVIEPAFQAALMPRVRAPPLVPLRGRAAVIPTVGLPPVAGPTDVEHRPAPRPAAPHRAPRHGSGHRPCTPRRRRMVRRRRGVTWETDPAAWEDGGARPGGRRSAAHGSRRLRDRTPSRPSGLARVCMNRTEYLGARSWGQATATGSSRDASSAGGPSPRGTSRRRAHDGERLHRRRDPPDREGQPAIPRPALTSSRRYHRIVARASAP